MRELELKRPSVFRAAGRVQVNNADGRPFYVFNEPKGFTFTLPKGRYQLSGGTLVGRMKKRNGHALLSGLRFQLPKRVRVVFSPNPNKASISLPDGIVVVDPSIRELPSFCLTYLLFHEIGHYFYKDEESCDRFAAEEMFRRGFNPSQIEQATAITMGNGYRRACNLATAKRLDNGR